MPVTNPTATADATADLVYRVEGMSCSHCARAVSTEVRGAIDETGYDAVPA